jgi:hypothetical protein
MMIPLVRRDWSVVWKELRTGWFPAGFENAPKEKWGFPGVKNDIPGAK